MRCEIPWPAQPWEARIALRRYLIHIRQLHHVNFILHAIGGSRCVGISIAPFAFLHRAKSGNFCMNPKNFNNFLYGQNLENLHDFSAQ